MTRYQDIVNVRSTLITSARLAKATHPAKSHFPSDNLSRCCPERLSLHKPLNTICYYPDIRQPAMTKSTGENLVHRNVQSGSDHKGLWGPWLDSRNKALRQTCFSILFGTRNATSIRMWLLQRVFDPRVQ